MPDIDDQYERMLEAEDRYYEQADDCYYYELEKEMEAEE